MDGAPAIPSTLTSELDNMHIYDKEKDPSHESNCPSHSDKVGIYDKVGEDLAKFYDPNNFRDPNEMWREEWEKIKDQFTKDAKFREAYLARAREERAKWASYNDEMIKLWYGEISDDSDMDGSDMDDE